MLTDDASRKVDSAIAYDEEAGETHATIVVRKFPINASARKNVSLLFGYQERLALPLITPEIKYQVLTSI